MTDRELLELIAAQVGKLTSKADNIEIELNDVKTKVSGLTSEVNDIKKIMLKIENDHGRKLDALFDGYKQNAEKLTRIEEEISKHEEIILRRV